MSYRLELSAAAVASTRFAISPLAETVAALQTLRLPRTRAGSALAWCEWASERWPADEDGLLLRALLAKSPRAPSFLAPSPRQMHSTLEDELADVRATPPSQVRTSMRRLFGDRHEMGHLPRIVDGDPDLGLETAARALKRAFDDLIRPFWARAQRIAEADIAWRSRALARSGFRGVFEGLHRDVVWESGGVRIWTTRQRIPEDVRTLKVRDDGIVLMPVVFLRPHVFFKSNGPQMTFGYPARGAGTLWLNEHATEAEDGIGALIGATRSDILTRLAIPATPTQIASDVGVTVGAISQHLAVLRKAGLVSSERAGRSVRYLRTAAGDALLAAPPRTRKGT